PFKHWIILHGPRGEKIRVMALFDLGATVCAMDEQFFERSRARLGKVAAPRKELRMANGYRVKSQAHWEGVMDVDGVKNGGAFEVFNSNGSWDFLLGKEMQAALGVVHDVKRDVITLNAGGRSATITN
ncbi:hypothetical protein C8R46DRAFT_808628, partial [Mycena filopes]